MSKTTFSTEWKIAQPNKLHNSTPPSKKKSLKNSRHQLSEEKR